MGNQESTTKVIKNFISTFSAKNLNEIPVEKKRETVSDLIANFNADKDLYSKFKEEQILELNFNPDEAKNDGKNDKKNEDNARIPLKCVEFCNILCLLTECECGNDNFDILKNLVEIMKIMINEMEFYRIFKNKLIDKLLKKLEEKDQNLNGEKIELMINIYKLFYETLNFIYLNRDSLKIHLPVITKIYNIPKKNTEKIKNKSVNFKLQKYKILNKLFEILKFVSESKDNKTIKSISESEELLKTILYDYNLNSVFREMLNDLEMKQATGNESIKMLIINCYTNLSYIDYIMINKYLTEEVIEKLTKFITMDSISTSKPEMIINPLKFLINYYIKSFDLGIFDNFKIFADDKSETLKSIFSMLTDLTQNEQNSSVREVNDHIVFLISCFFITISLKSNVWEKVKEKHLIKPSCDCIKKFIYETFSRENFPDGDIPSDLAAQQSQSKNLEFFRKDVDEHKENLKIRFGLIKLLAKILGFIAKEKVYRKIYHIEFFKHIFNFVIDLFHIDYADINADIYSIFNVCTYFTECKLHFYLEKESNFKILRNDLFSRIKLTLSNYNSIKETYLRNENIKNSSRSKKEEMDNDDIKTAVDEKMKLFDNINNKNRVFATANFNEFTILMSILCNLLIMNDFSVFKKLLFNGFDMDVEVFKNDLAAFIEDFEKKSNNKYRIISYDKFVHPAKLFLMIYDPMIKFIGGKMYCLDETNEKSRYHDIIREHKLILDSTSNDHDTHHKILFVIYRFLSKCKSHKEISEVIDSIISSADNYIYNLESNIIVNREWLRLLHSLLQFSENTLFWLKCDSNKVYIDFANNCDVVIKHKEERDLMNKKINSNIQHLTTGGKNLHEKVQNHGDKNASENRDDIINLPFHRVKSFNEMGIIMFTTHHLLIPKVLHLGKTFTIFFRFYFPMIDTDSEHVLLQDCTGTVPLISVTRDRKNLVCYSKTGELVDSGVNLEQRNLQGWLHAAISYSETSNHRKITFFFQNSQMNSYEKEGFQLPDNIAYIGNSKDFNSPFGAFCDLRVYSTAVDINGYRQIAKINDDEKNNNRNNPGEGSGYISFMSKINNTIMPKILNKFLDINASGNPLKCNDFDNTEESFYFFIKVLNAILINKENRNSYIRYELIFKIMEFLCAKSVEIKKDIAKFLNTIA